MARLLFVSRDMPGMLYPAVELARRLARAGHAVVYASRGADARVTVEANGIDFRQLEPSRYERFLAVDAGCGLISRLRRVRSRRAAAAESLRQEAITRVLAETGPDLVLVDGEMHEEIIELVGCGARVALLNSFVSIWRRPGLPPPHAPVRPGVGWKGSQAGIWLLWEALRWRKRWRALSLAVRRVGCDRRAMLRRLALERGVDLGRETDVGQWLVPFTWRSPPVLTMHARELEFPHEPPTNAFYLGPLVLDNRPSPAELEPPGRDLARIFDRCRATGNKLVYAGFGSFFTTDRDFLARLIDAVTSRDDWELVVSLGGRLEPSRLGKLSERIHIFSWLPQLEVLRHADVAVIHGGITTVDECVLEGVPMLVYCGFETDMGGTMARVVHHGLGVAGDRRRDDSGAIVSRIERLLHDPEVRRRLGEFRAIFEAYREERVAVGAVESILGSGNEERLS